MDIGSKLHRIRLIQGLTQEELADRAGLSKGFISQLERDLSSPSIITLERLLECLGTDLKSFFEDEVNQKVVFKEEDTIEKDYEDQGTRMRWLIPNAQNNSMEPVIVTLQPGASTDQHPPHDGEEFGYVMSGSIVLQLGAMREKVRKGESFCFDPDISHAITNPGRSIAKVLWVANPPSF